MVSNYEEIREKNQRRYGTDIARVGAILLHDRYSDRSQFIFELIQNAEDAFSRRENWNGSRAVSFDLQSDSLRVSHFGIPFDEQDVLGICGIGHSAKRLNAIGRFGIGFKSVYAYTDCPQIHSGSESFAINSYVLPFATEPVTRNDEETVFVLPLGPQADSSKEEILAGLSRIGAASLLFLREIEEIRWSVDGEAIGHYIRQTKKRNSNARLVTVMGQIEGETSVNIQDWLVFSRAVYTSSGDSNGHVEVAWQIQHDEDGRATIHPIDHSPLIVFFPTIVETHLGFLVQGPYRTTPSRDNVPQRDKWNLHCVNQTGELLLESLLYLREEGFLNASALSCLPINRKRFAGTMFEQLYYASRDAIRNHKLLPTHGGGYAKARESIIARTLGLRNLVSPQQMAALFGEDRPLMCLDATISQDRTPELHEFLRAEFDMYEFTPNVLINKLTSKFLEQQEDRWIEQLYVFLGSQRVLLPNLSARPIVRLTDGSHVVPVLNGTPKAFLPGRVITSFPIVRHSVCQDKAAIEFLKNLGLREPNPIDDVIQHVLSKYQNTADEISEVQYAADVERILVASASDSIEQKQELLRQLKKTRWVRAVEANNRSSVWKTPEQVYLPTNRLLELFNGVVGIYFVDSSTTCLRGTRIRELLESSGAARVLRTVPIACDLASTELDALRRKNGLEAASWQKIEDKTIQGLTLLLDELQTLDTEKRARRSVLLWQELIALYRHRGFGVFDTTYTWRYSHQVKRVHIDPAFVRELNKRTWIPDSSGHPRAPGSVDFNDTEFERDSFLESKIRFRPPVMEQLATEAGIEPGVVELLLELNLKNVNDLKQRLGVKEERRNTNHQANGVEPSKSKEGKSVIKSTSDGAGQGRTGSRQSHVQDSSGRAVVKKHFISYVGVRSENLERDAEGLTQTAKMELEAAAIRFVRRREPEWKCTSPNNKGFDLYRGQTPETAVRWCEVKAMKGTLDDHPVGVSRSQFEWAQKHGKAYWLYVVEHAGSERPSIVRIQNPIGNAETFTFDKGWREIAADE